MSKECKDYKVIECTYSAKISFMLGNDLWNSFEHTQKVEIHNEHNIQQIHSECWYNVLQEVENKLDESREVHGLK